MSQLSRDIKRNHRMSIKTRRAINGYLFILPFILGFLLFMIRPLIHSLWMSMCNVEIDATGFHNTWNSFQNYIKAFTVDAYFTRYLTEEFTKIVSHTAAILVLSLVVAIILNQEFKGRAFVRAVFFLPVILSSGVLVGLETNNSLMSSISNMMKENSNIQLSDTVVSIMRLSGLGSGILDVVVDIISQIKDIVMASGIQIIVFLTGLQSIPDALYEAADIEGCTKWESFWKITFPMISPLLIVNIIYSVIDFFMKTDSNVMNKIRDAMVINLDYGFASAMSWVYFGLVIVLIGICSLIFSKRVVGNHA
jgi:ABC-type sugar transport system permease subunit